jgi:hypothetical protein
VIEPRICEDISFIHTLSGTLEEFIHEMLSYGRPIELSLVGNFDPEGRGSRRDINLDWHRDGDYSKETANKYSIDIVGLYCLIPGETITMIKDPQYENLMEVCLKKGQSIIFDNKRCVHARKGPVGDRLLVRMWVEKNESR